MSRFFDLPNRGGLLIILNAVLWLLFTLYVDSCSRVNTPPRHEVMPILVGAYFALSLPLTPCLIPSNGHGFRNQEELVIWCALLGLNAFLWGHGLSCLLTHRLRPANLRSYFFPDLTPIDQRRPPPDPKCPTCGYDTRATPTRCPECGTTLPPSPR